MSDGAVSTQSQIFIFVSGSVIVALMAGVVTWVRKKIGCQDKIEARTLRQSHAMIWQAQQNDEETFRLHPNLPKPNTAEQMQKLLEDEYGNL